MTVADLFDRLMPRMRHFDPAMDFTDAVQAVQDVITRRLWEKKSDLLLAAWESDEQEAETATVTLPDAFLGVVGKHDKPYITYTAAGSTQVAILEPLAGARSRYETISATIPTEYEIRGTTFELFAVPSVAYTLYVPMYQSPDEITAMTDTLPWNGAFNQLFQDALPHLSEGQGALSYVTPMLEQAIRQAVDTGAGLRTGRRVKWLTS